MQQHPPFTPKAFYRRLRPQPRSHDGPASCIRSRCTLYITLHQYMYRHATYWLMHLPVIFPVPVIFGGTKAYRKSLILSDTPIPPFTPFEKELGYHQTCDANLGSTGDFKAIPGSTRLVVGTSSTEWRSLPSSLRLALDGQAAPRRKGAAEYSPGAVKGSGCETLNL